MGLSLQDIGNAVKAAGYYALEMRLGKGRRRLVCASRRDRQGPGGVSFSVERRGERWFLAAWAPLHYLIPPHQNVAAVCLEVLRDGGRALAELPPDIVRRYGLIALTEEEFERKEAS
jgi:hypothetical protein